MQLERNKSLSPNPSPQERGVANAGRLF